MPSIVQQVCAAVVTQLSSYVYHQCLVPDAACCLVVVERCNCMFALHSECIR